MSTIYDPASLTLNTQMILLASITQSTLASLGIPPDTVIDITKKIVIEYGKEYESLSTKLQTEYDLRKIQEVLKEKIKETGVTGFDI